MEVIPRRVVVNIFYQQLSRKIYLSIVQSKSLDNPLSMLPGMVVFLILLENQLCHRFFPRAIVSPFAEDLPKAQNVEILYPKLSATHRNNIALARINSQSK